MRRFISVLLCLTLFMSIIPAFEVGATFSTTNFPRDVHTKEVFSGGSGTAEDPYQISNGAQLACMHGYLDSHFKLICDIEFTDADFAYGGSFYGNGSGWVPIGSSSSAPFTGSFDGNGFVIKNLQLKHSSEHGNISGLFGYNKGVIENLGLVGGVLSSDEWELGGIAGSNSGIIRKCYNVCKVTGNYIGGIAGNNTGVIESCYNLGEIRALDRFDSSAGGIANGNSGIIRNCYNAGTISSGSTGSIGGIFNGNLESGLVENCYNIGLTIGYVSYGIGSNWQGGSVVNCYYLDTTSYGTSSTQETAIRCTAEQLTVPATFVGFDFESTWTFLHNESKYLAPILTDVKHVEKTVHNNSAEFAGGCGTCFSPYLISNTTHLNNVRNYPYAHFKMINDVVFAEKDFTAGGSFYNEGKGFIPIGSSEAPFGGVFDGNGFVVKNLFMDNSEAEYIGLFGVNHNIIKNLGVVDGNIFSYNNKAGGISGCNCYGTISNCYSTCNIFGSYAGGITFSNDMGKIENCYNQGNITATLVAGGIAGVSTYSTIENCYNSGSVTAKAVGGIVGTLASPVINCYNTGEICGISDTGGIAGRCSAGGADIINCYNTGTISGFELTGGIAGGGYASIRNCHNSGTVSGELKAGGIAGGRVNSRTIISNCHNTGNVEADYAGGIVGHAYANVSTCYNTGNITGITYSGGIAGYHTVDMYIRFSYNTGIISGSYAVGGVSGGGYASIENCFNTGDILCSESTKYAGGISGEFNSHTIAYCYNIGNVADALYKGGISGTYGRYYAGGTNCYYLNTISTGIGTCDTDVSKKCTAEELQTQSTFEFFDFETVWIMGDCNYRYPVLRGFDVHKDRICTLCYAEEPDQVIHNPFVDVKKEDYFYTPVLWAVKEGVTTGISATTFGPEKPCTRGQVVTFLWRACGSPEPQSTVNPFSDISEKAYYYKAVLWAVENGITQGTGKNKFSPEDTCTRGQVATFLWRLHSKPSATEGNNPFSDISEEAYYYNAILWAVENSITQGTGKGKFSPDGYCTRGQIVTFLYRDFTTSPYISLIQMLMVRSEGTRAKGMFYDIDNNGIAELIFLYVDNRENEEFLIPVVRYCVYTISNHTAVPLLEDEVLFAESSAAQGWVGVVSIKGRSYFGSWAQNGTYDSIWESWKIYAPEGSAFRLVAEVAYETIDEIFTGTINGESVDSNTYKAWIDSVVQIRTVDSYGYNLDILLQKCYNRALYYLS